MALFRWTVFRRDAVFEGARFAGAANFGRAQFHGPARFDGATLHRRPEVDQARASTAYPHSWPPGVSTSALDDDRLTLTAGAGTGSYRGATQVNVTWISVTRSSRQRSSIVPDPPASQPNRTRSVSPAVATDRTVMVSSGGCSR